MIRRRCELCILLMLFCFWKWDIEGLEGVLQGEAVMNGI